MKAPQKQIPEERQALYNVGGVMLVAGFLLCFGTIAVGALSVSSHRFGDSPESPVPFLIGFVLFGLGGLLRSVGAGGLAGSGVILDPEQARNDLEPWSRMTGGMVSDALSEVDIVQKLAEPQVKVRCQQCHALNDEDAKFCKQCGQPL